MTVRLSFDGRKWYLVVCENGRLIERWGWLMELL